MDKNSYIGVYFYKSSKGHLSNLDFLELVSYAKSLNRVTVVWYNSDMSLSESDRVTSLIKEKKINRIVIAGEDQGYLKPFFTKAMVSVGKAPENVVLASFKERDAITKGDTERAKAILACSLYGIPFETVVSPEEATVNPDTVVIGAGMVCIQASLEIADSGNKVYLVEKPVP